MRLQKPHGGGGATETLPPPQHPGTGAGRPGFQNNLSSREGRSKGGTYESSRAYSLPAQLRTQKDLERESAVGSSVPANPWTHPPNQAPWLRRPGEVARPTSPGFAESRTAARHPADPTDPAAAPRNGGQTWQRPGSVVTTCGRPPPGSAHPHLTLWGIHPPRGSPAVQARRGPPRATGHMLSTLSPQAGQPGKDPLGWMRWRQEPREEAPGAAGDGRLRPYLDGKAK